VCTTLFNRNADDFREKRLSDQTSVRIIRRYRCKRTIVAANKFCAVSVKRDCAAQLLQQIKRDRKPFISILFFQPVHMFVRQNSPNLTHASSQFPPRKPLGDAGQEAVQQ